jgi:hypothetical protein
MKSDNDQRQGELMEWAKPMNTLIEIGIMKGQGRLQWVWVQGFALVVLHLGLVLSVESGASKDPVCIAFCWC